MKILCQLAFCSASNFFPKSYLLEGKRGYNLHTYEEVIIDKELEIDADIKGNIPSYPGIDGCEFEMFVNGNIGEFDIIDFGKIDNNITVYVKQILR